MESSLPDPGLVLLATLLLAAAAAVLFWPDRGLVARGRRSRRLTKRVLVEDALKHVRKCELGSRPATLQGIAGAVGLSIDDTGDLLARMQTMGLLTTAPDGFALTPDGRASALHIIRAHRLWERYLAEHTGYPESEWHGLAETQEHELGPEDADALSARLGHPTHDPHGDPIPDARGSFVAHGGVPLGSVEVGTKARIVHLEDEPKAVYEQLVAAGLHPGMGVQIVSADAQRVRLWAAGDELALAPVVAANVSVVPIEEESEAPELAEADALLSLRPGETATVIGISPRCRGSQRRRLLDLGVLPGASVSAEMVSPTGGSTAYRIRDALIALRHEQASLIQVSRPAEATR